MELFTNIFENSNHEFVQIIDFNNSANKNLILHKDFGNLSNNIKYGIKFRHRWHQFLILGALAYLLWQYLLYGIQL